MKKIISFLMAGALLLGTFIGVTSCSGDLHDAETVSPDLKAGGPIGDFYKGWNGNNATPWSKIDGDTYQLTFTCDADSGGAGSGWKIQSTVGSWTNQIIAKNDGDECKIGGGKLEVQLVKDAPAGNITTKGMKAGKTYKILCTCEDGKIYVSIDEDSPVIPFRLEGAYIRGLHDSSWAIVGAGAIYDPDIDAATGYATYQVQVDDLKNLTFKIGGPKDWEYNWGFPASDTPGLTDGGDFVKLTNDNAQNIKLLDSGDGAFATGDAAMITILTKPAYEDKSNPQKSVDRDGDEVINYPTVPEEIWIKAEKLVVTKVTKIVLKTPPEIGGAGYIAFCEGWVPKNDWGNGTPNKVNSLKDGMAILDLSDAYSITLSQKASLSIQILNPPSDADFWDEGGKIGGGAIKSEAITAGDMANFVKYSKTSDFNTNGVWLTVFKTGNGEWTARIEQPEQVLYFDNTNASLKAVNVHYWGDGGTAWPGVPCTQLGSPNDKLWKAYVPACATGVIFNGTKTDDSAWQTENIENAAIVAKHKYTGDTDTGKAPTDGGEFSE